MRSVRFLLVDPHGESVQTVARVLAGCIRINPRLEAVDSLEEGLARLEPIAPNGRPDCVLVCMRPGDLDTTAFIKRARIILNQGRPGPRPPLIVLAHHGHERLAVSAMKAGASDYLPLNGLTSSELARAWAYARNQAFIEAQHAARQDELKRRAEQDPLTGLANRGTLDERLDQALRCAARNQAPVSVLLLDVDHFKTINDTHGHQVGDEVLQAIAKVVQGSLRDSDIAGRYGGEELCLVLPRTALPAATGVAERLRRAMWSHLHTSPGGEPFRVTVSIGVASWMPDVCTPARGPLLEAADQALYRAKRTGRDRVVAAGAEETPPPELANHLAGRANPGPTVRVTG